MVRWGKKRHNFLMVAILVFLGLGLGISGVQAGETTTGAIAGIQPPVKAMPLESRTPLEFRMLFAEPGAESAIRTPLAGRQKPVFLWQIGNMQVTGTAGLATRPHFDTLPQASATVKFPPDLELRVSFLYDLNNLASQSQRSVHSHLLFKYSMDYRVMPNFQVGLTGYLYQQRSPDFLTFRGPRLDDSVMGLGPGVKYDLGRWSFIFQSQLETGTTDRNDSLNNWFRIWYAF